VQEPCKGCFAFSSGLPDGQAGPSGCRLRLRGAGIVCLWADLTKRVGGARAKARIRLLPANPKRVKPKGAASDGRTKPASVARDSRKGQSPETAARWAGPPLRRRDYRREKRYVGPSPPKGGGYLPRGESSAGLIPRAPPVCKKTGTGSEGVNRREGNQTLRADRSGNRQLPRQWISDPSSAEGKQSP